MRRKDRPDDAPPIAAVLLGVNADAAGLVAARAALLAELDAAGIATATLAAHDTAADQATATGALLRAAGSLGVEPGRAAVVGDALGLIEAASAGGFAQIVAVERRGDGAVLERAGAGLVVSDLAELALSPAPRLVARTLQTVPLVWEAQDLLEARMEGRRLAVFLDYDGVLTPIVADPGQAVLADGMRAALSNLAARLPVAIVSGRDRDDVQAMVGDDTLYYAGSHGFDFAGPKGWSEVVDAGARFLPALERASRSLEELLARIDGARVEKKRFSLAIHYRQVADAQEEAVARAVRETVAGHPDLAASAGKKVFDVKPRFDWHKGRAVLALLDRLDLDGDDVLPVYLGDDTTDEDAFRIISGRGIGIVVRDGVDRRTAARFALRGTQDVERFLVWLADEAARSRT